MATLQQAKRQLQATLRQLRKPQVSQRSAMVTKLAQAREDSGPPELAQPNWLTRSLSPPLT
jgi:hypothetical protein